MKCHICDQEVSSSSAYCDFCGAEMNREFEDVAMDLVRETENEKRDKMEKETEKYLVMAVFFFVTVFTLYYIVPELPKVDTNPAFFHPPKKVKQEKPQVPFIEGEIPQ